MALRLGGRTAALLLLSALPAQGRDLLVGPGHPYDQPSAAIRAAQPGDQVLIDPGEYYDCATWNTPNLTIAGRGPGVVLTDVTCQGKAILVVGGAGTTIRALTLTRARVPDGNGAGIRLEAPGLTLDAVTFINDQAGLLSGAAGGAIIVTNCRFEGVGVAGDRPTYAILSGPADQLLVRGSTFDGGMGGAISSGAAETTLAGNTVTAPGILPPIVAAGRLTMVGNTFEVGAGATGRRAAVLALGDAGPVLRGNRLTHTGPALALLLDWSAGTPVLDGNQVPAGDAESSTEGAWRHRASDAAHGAKDGLRAWAGRAKRFIRGQ